MPLSLAIRSDMACPFNGECGGYMQLAPSLFPLFHPAPFFFLQPPAAVSFGHYMSAALSTYSVGACTGACVHFFSFLCHGGGSQGA